MLSFSIAKQLPSSYKSFKGVHLLLQRNWNRFPRKDVNFPSLQMFKARWDAICSCGSGSCARQGVLNSMMSKVPSKAIFDSMKDSHVIKKITLRKHNLYINIHFFN